jgi:hypothetical protein
MTSPGPPFRHVTICKITAERAWEKLNIGVKVDLIR